MNDRKAYLESYLKEKKLLVDRALEECLPGEDNFPEIIFQSVRYSMFAGGKRLRPILCLASAEAVGGDSSRLLPVACALEMIHTYSLIHDDLPVMDDDDYRRGRLTNHRVFGEDMAVLAGDALLTEAFHLLARKETASHFPPEKILCAISEIARAAGIFGMVGGQVADIQAEGKAADPKILEFIHRHKTGEMIRVSVITGALLGGADDNSIKSPGKVRRKYRACLSDHGRYPRYRRRQGHPGKGNRTGCRLQQNDLPIPHGGRAGPAKGQIPS